MTKYLFLIACLFLVNLGHTQSPEINLAKEYLSTLPDKVEFAIGVIDGDSTYYIGLRKENGKVITVNNAESIFEIASITKIFTAALTLKNIQEGKMSLDDPIQQYLNVKMAKDTFKGTYISVAHLLTHSSGLNPAPNTFIPPYLWAKIVSRKNPNKFFKEKHYNKYLRKFKLDYIPGKEWAYNNCGYGLLGVFAEKLEGQAWSDLIQANFFDKLAMKNSVFRITSKEKNRFVSGILSNGKKSKPFAMDFISAAGDIKSTATDMLLFLDWQMQEQVPEYIKTLQTKANPELPLIKLWKGNSMGYGWWHNEQKEGYPFLWHSGSSGGYTSFAGFDKGRKKAVIVLTNVSSNHSQGRMENRIPKGVSLGMELMRLEH